MKTRRLGAHGPLSSALGLGCMGMSFAYGSAATRDPAQARETLAAALELGITHFDTAEVYGPYANEELLGPVLAPYRDRLLIATKFGFRIEDDKIAGLDGSPANARRALEASLRRLGTDHVDILYLHRLDASVPVEETVGAMAALVREGKVRHLGLCEVSAATLRRAASVHPIAALQSEYSLWERSLEESVLPACRELGIGLVPYCPLGRGFLTGKVARADDYAATGDMRTHQPRFQGENWDLNARLVAGLQALAAAKGCTAAQLALAWLLAQGEDIVPIPGTASRRHLAENAAASDLTLSAGELEALATLFPRGSAAGERYGATQLAWIDR